MLPNAPGAGFAIALEDLQQEPATSSQPALISAPRPTFPVTIQPAQSQPTAGSSTISLLKKLGFKIAKYVARTTVILTFALAVLAIVPTWRSYVLSQWTARKDFIEYCRDHMVRYSPLSRRRITDLCRRHSAIPRKRTVRAQLRTALGRPHILACALQSVSSTDSFAVSRCPPVLQMQELD